jgi:mono/diheme cytochrome c family protein
MARTDLGRLNRAKHLAKLTMVLAPALSLWLVAPQYDGAANGFSPVVGTGRAVDAKDDAGAREAFLAAYKVFMHPRCMNCHPAGDVPLQGDDSHLHAQNVKRGPDGKGRYALKCANCHQDTNLPGENMPPGNPNWRLPPPEMRMVFQGKTPAELARQLKDPKLNGGKTLEQLLHHVAEDKLVKSGWDPGDGRTKLPLSHDDFARKMREWIEKGAPVPE